MLSQLSQERKAQRLLPSDRLALIFAMVESLKGTTVAQPDRSGRWLSAAMIRVRLLRLAFTHGLSWSTR